MNDQAHGTAIQEVGKSKSRDRTAAIALGDFAIPEPASLTVLIGALALTGLAGRRRRR